MGWTYAHAEEKSHRRGPVVATASSSNPNLRRKRSLKGSTASAVLGAAIDAAACSRAIVAERSSCGLASAPSTISIGRRCLQGIGGVAALGEVLRTLHSWAPLVGGIEGRERLRGTEPRAEEAPV